MERLLPEFCVLGVGHFAAAVRTQLPLLAGASVARSARGRDVSRIVLACSDYLSPSSFTDANRRAVGERSPILFAWLADGKVRLGPFVVPRASPCFECQPARRWDFSLDDIAHTCGAPAPRPTLNPDTLLQSLAHFGALLVIRELSTLVHGAQATRLVGRVAEFDPPCIHPCIVDLVRSPDCRACSAS